MSDTDTPGAAASAGERLKLAREQAGLSVEKVAKDLFLDTRVIHAIEVNRFKDLGAPVYAKGYLRKYARLLGVSEEEVLVQYQKSPDATPAPAMIPVALGSIPDARRSLPGWVRWLVLAIIVLAGVATLMNLRSSDDEPVHEATISHPLRDATSGAAGSETDTSVVESDSPLANIATNTSATDTLTLRFGFTGNSWIEVSDAQNQSLLREMGNANTSREITAAPPIHVLLGAAAMVRVKVNGQDINIPASAKQGDVAKFVVKADGSLE